MRTSVRVLAGIGSVLPILGTFGTAIYVAAVMISHDLATGGAMAADPIGTFIELGMWQVVLGASIAIAIFQLMLMIAFAVHALTRKQIGSGIKALWIVAFYLVGFAALPAYWVMHMRVDEPTA